MRLRWAALAAATYVLCAPLAAQDARTLTLDQAFAYVVAKHPDLARFRFLHEGAQAEIESAALRPPLNASLELENALGTGAASGFDEAEITLSLASILERGGKREARQAVADAQMQALGLEEQARRLDLLAEVARRYLDLLAAQTLVRIAETDLTQRQQLVEASAQRVRAGASPESVRFTAEAAVARARLQRERAVAETHLAARRLAAMWNDRAPNFERVTGDPLALPPAPTLDSLSALLDRSPELKRFADETRMREARLQLARSARTTDIQWQAGVRRLQETDDWAAVAGFSVPLGSKSRAAPRLRAAEADLAALSLERESEQMTLYATLTDAQARLVSATVEVEMARTELLPRLQQAEQAVERAYRAGATSYLEWAQIQSEISAARREQVQAAIEGHRALIEIQRLTGESFVSGTAARLETQP